MIPATSDTHLDRGVNAAYSDKRQIGMPLDNIHDGPIALEDVVQPAGVLLPHEPIAIVGARNDELVPWAQEIDFGEAQVSIRQTSQSLPTHHP